MNKYNTVSVCIFHFPQQWTVLILISINTTPRVTHIKHPFSPLTDKTTLDLIHWRWDIVIILWESSIHVGDGGRLGFRYLPPTSALIWSIRRQIWLTGVLEDEEVCAHCNGDQVTPKDDYVSAVDGGECDVGMDRTPLGTSGSKEQHFFSSFHQQPIHHHHRHSQPQQSCRAMEITIFRTSILHYQLLHMAPTIINTISREWKIQIIMWLVESTTNSIY